MRYLKLFEAHDVEFESKYEIILDSIVELMDKFGFTYYDEDDENCDEDDENCDEDDENCDEDDENGPPEQPYYDISYSRNQQKQLVVSQINICNISMSYCEPKEMVDELMKIKPKLELRSGLKLKIDYYSGEDHDFISITKK